MLVGGRYEIIRELGRGGFGKTYLAQDTYRRGSPPCVVKKIPPRSKDPMLFQAARELLDAETATLYKLGTHEQIPRLFAHFEQNGEFYVVQELIDGHNLKQVLTLGMQLDEDRVVVLLQEILEILAFVHEHNVTHQDVKPDNLIRRWKDKKLVLIDFAGIKAIRHLTINAAGQATVIQSSGTPGYMPIEQANGQPLFCSDIYAVGMIGIQALTGFLPNQLPRDPQTQELSWHDQAKVSSELAAILDKMVCYQHEQRYQSVAEVLAALPVQTVVASSANSLLEEVIKPDYKVLIEPQFDFACSFSENLAAVSIDHKLGYINKTGRLVIQPELTFNPISQFRGAYQFSHGLARVEVNHKWGYIDRTGILAIPCRFDHAETFAEGIARVEIDSRYGYIDETGAFVVKPQFESAASNFAEGLAAVEIDHQHGYIDKAGRVIIQPQFDSADDFAEGLARITLNDKYGFIDKSGKLVIQPQFDVAHTFSEGLARVRVDGKYGYIDKTGNIVIKPEFDDTFSFSNGLALVRNGHKYGYIDKAGNLVIRLQFDDAYPFSSKLAAVKLINKWGYINTQGEFLIDLQFDDAGSLANDMAAIKVDNRWGYIGG